MTRVLVWIAEGNWRASVDAAASVLREGDRVTLLHVTPGEVSRAAGGAVAGLLGRRRPRPEDVERQLAAVEEAAATDLLAAAAERLAHPAERIARAGRVEHEVIAAARDADLLVCVREGGRAGPHSIGHPTRFVVDHAPCALLLAWPEGEPESGGGPGPGPGGGPKGGTEGGPAPPHRPRGPRQH